MLRSPPQISTVNSQPTTPEPSRSRDRTEVANLTHETTWPKPNKEKNTPHSKVCHSRSPPPFHSPPTNANRCRASSRPRCQSSSPSSATWQRCAAWRSPPTRSTRPNWSVGFATYTTAKRLSPSAWRPRSRRKIASSPLIAITVLSSIFLSLWVWNFVELFGLLRFSGFMGCWKLFGIFWVVHVLVCGDFSC